MTGIGDDCAVIPQESGLDTLVSTDMLIEGVHFLRDDVKPFDLGWKSVAVNLSDIAAMGGKPVATFLSLALPAGTDTAWVDAFIDGYRYVRSYVDGTTIITFLNCERELQSMNLILAMTLAISGAALILVFVLVLLFSSVNR